MGKSSNYFSWSVNIYVNVWKAHIFVPITTTQDCQGTEGAGKPYSGNMSWARIDEEFPQKSRRRKVITGKGRTTQRITGDKTQKWKQTKTNENKKPEPLENREELDMTSDAETRLGEGKTKRWIWKDRWSSVKKFVPHPTDKERQRVSQQRLEGREHSSSPFSTGTRSHHPRRHLKLQRVPNPIYTMFFPMHTDLW